MVLSIVAIGQWVQSYLKANRKNKSRSIVAGLFVAGGGSLGWWLVLFWHLFALWV